MSAQLRKPHDTTRLSLLVGGVSKEKAMRLAAARKISVSRLFENLLEEERARAARPKKRPPAGSA